MSDRELLEWAAKAMFADFANQMLESGWDPLTYDGDALRLVVKLKMTVITLSDSVEVNSYDNAHCGQEMTCDGQDPYAATRRAIVRAAAEIGKAMK
jgi:lipopolysaccharide export system protein LptA